jgi:hypothetical protein
MGERLENQSLASRSLFATHGLQVKRPFTPVMYIRISRFKSERMSLL